MTRKHSHKRDAIVDAICSSKEHPSAETVYATLKTEFPSLSLGTVYRNIAMLRSEGVIKSVGIVNGEERYDGNLSDHAHFVCESCNAVIDIMSTVSPTTASNAEIEARHNVKILRRHFVYYGTCGKCLEDAESEKSV